MNYIYLKTRVETFNFIDRTLNNLPMSFKNDINFNRRYYNIQNLNDFI